MFAWGKNIQELVQEVDRCIRAQEDEGLTLRHLAQKLGYSEYHVSHMFRRVSGMQLRDYLWGRRLAFALRDVRDTEDSLLTIALRYGFSSHEAFTRAFKDAYGVAPSRYRQHPVPVVLRTVIHPFDCYLLGIGGTGMADTNQEVKTYFVTIPAHKYLHIRNYESIGYWDFWQKQSRIPEQDCDTICGLLESIPHKLDDAGGAENDAGSGQIMAFINEPAGARLLLGHPPGGELRRASAGGLRRPRAEADAADGRGGGGVHRF